MIRKKRGRQREVANVNPSPADSRRRKEWGLNSTLSVIGRGHHRICKPTGPRGRFRGGYDTLPHEPQMGKTRTTNEPTKSEARPSKRFGVNNGTRLRGRRNETRLFWGSLKRRKGKCSRDPRASEKYFCRHGGGRRPVEPVWCAPKPAT